MRILWLRPRQAAAPTPAPAKADASDDVAKAVPAHFQRPGDAILQIGARAVKNSRDFTSALGEIRPGSDTVMLVVRGQYSYYVTVPL